MNESIRDVLRYQLLEGLTSVLYHGLTIYNLAAQLKSNKAMTSPAFTNPSDFQRNKKRLYFISTARTMQSRYFDMMGTGYAIVTLDGRKLGYRYKGAAVDYWGGEFRKAAKGAYEQEDRLFTDEPFIENWKSYITAIRVMAEPAEKVWHKPRERDLQTIAYIEKQAKAAGIPFAIFTNRAEFHKPRSTKFYKSVDEVRAFYKRKDVEIEPAGPKYKRSDRKPDYVKTVEDFLKVVSLFEHGKLASASKTLRGRFRQTFRYMGNRLSDSWTVFQNDVGSISKDLEYRELYNQVGKAIRRNRMHSLKELVLAVAKAANEAWKK